MRHFFYLVFAAFLLQSCGPTYSLLQRYEFSEQLSDKVLYVSLYNIEEEVQLYREYNQSAQVERLRENLLQQNQLIQKAFQEAYDFTDFVFYEPYGRFDPDGHFTAHFEIQDHYDDRGIRNQMHVLVLTTPDNQQFVLGSSPAGFSNSYQRAVNTANIRLHGWHQDGLALKEKKN
ncbi:MAG: hypothetical protein Q4F57_01025 [Weeksellaceae bacterium]|nr:hypothetical protein [Weeksellaceae bacterium]